MQKPLLSISLAMTGHGTVLASLQIAGSLARNRTVRPGESIEGVVVLKNHSAEPVQMHIQTTDYEAFSREAEVSAHPKSAPQPEQTLLHIEPNEFHMEANESVRVHYRCQAPANRNLKGTYWGIALLERTPVGNIAPDEARFDGRQTQEHAIESSPSRRPPGKHRRVTNIAA